MENTNNADYAHDLEFMAKLITALEYLIQVCEENPVRYPMAIADVTCLIHGRPLQADDEVILFNGLLCQIEEMYATLDALQLEVDYRGWRCA